MSTASQRRRISQLRLVAQRLVGEPWDTPSDAASAMMCMQGQDWPGAIVSLALRTRSRSTVEVYEAFNSAQLVRSWPQRGTLHVLPACDVGWYLKLTAHPRLLGQEKRRSNHGIESRHIDEARAHTIELLQSGEIGSAGAASRDVLLAAWRERGVLPDKSWGYYLLHHLCVEGTLVQGPVAPDGNQLFVLSADWIASPRTIDRASAVNEVVLRYLTSHGPASRKDINWWSQLPLREIDAAIGGCAGELTGLKVDDETYWVHNSVLERCERMGTSSLSRSLLALPGFDELILGYASRWMTIPEAHAEDLVPGNNGVFRKSIISGGTAIGFWRPGKTKPTVELFKDPTPAFERRLENTFAELPA